MLNKALYVGDSLVDAEAAARAGVAFAAVTTGATVGEEFSTYRPVAVLDRLAKVSHLLMAQ